MRDFPRKSLAQGGVAAICLAACVYLTWTQEKYWHDTISLFTRDLELFPRGNAMAHHCLGRAFFEQGDDRAAAREYEELLRLLPDSARAHLGLADCLSHSGQTMEAMEHYRRALLLDPKSPEAHKSLGVCLASQMKLDEAQTNFLTAIRLKPDYAEAYLRLGTSEMAQGNSAAGMQHLKTAVAIFPAYPDPHYYLAHALADEGKMDEAALHFRAAIKSNPLYLDAINDFAWMLITNDKAGSNDAAEALQLARKACALTSRTNAACLETLGAALSRTGRFDEAVQTIETGIVVANLETNADASARMQKQLAWYRKGQSYPAGAR